MARHDHERYGRLIVWWFLFPGNIWPGPSLPLRLVPIAVSTMFALGVQIGSGTECFARESRLDGLKARKNSSRLARDQSTFSWF